MARIPIEPGFSIELLPDGRPLAHVSGKSGTEAVRALEDWLERHPDDVRASFVVEWLAAEYNQRAAEQKEHNQMLERDEINEHIDRIIKSTKSSLLSPNTKKLLRQAARKIRYKEAGLPEDE